MFSQSSSASQPPLHAPSFSVGGMSGSTNTHHPHGATSWASNSQSAPLSGSLNDPFLQSRSNYQSGYLMSMSQNNGSPSANQRLDDMPIVQTKAKLNSTLSRAPTREFGKDPMFESSRQRQTPDEDAPPTCVHSPSYQRSVSRTPQPSSHQTLEPLYVVVFGYPPDKYSVAVEYFKQLGETTDPDPNTEISNCFKIGFRHPGEAMWAVRKNGEIVSGSWMVGVKWADPAQAERVLGQSIARTTTYLPTPDITPSSDPPPVDPLGSSRLSHQHSLSGSRSPHGGTPAVGTPIRLAPSTSCVSGQQLAAPVAVGTPGTPSKSMIGQFSDLVFGW
ncbi:hypothetical protein EDB83DRAFT_2361782 [Lactarius deliciosus]|nr:hypothetical protein EDB83DRAFT_2361782 [Lactarius deliciosus]